MKVLITYFESFGGRSLNASKEIVSSLSELVKGEKIINIEKKELMVSWNNIEHEVDSTINKDINYYILCGEAASYKNITLELRADNICRGVDKYNINPGIDEQFKEYYTCCDKKIFDGLNIDYSLSAGSYLCNRVYYLMLSKLNKKNVIFIHFPLIKEQSGEFEKEYCVNVLEEIIRRLSK